MKISSKLVGVNNKHFQMPKTLVKILLDKGGFPKKSWLLVIIAMYNYRPIYTCCIENCLKFDLTLPTQMLM
jgi:hypothetical protein